MMLQYAVKILISAVIIVAVSELAKRSPNWAAMLASLPLISLLAFIWLYVDTGDARRVADLSQGIFWLVLPSLVLFLLLPVLIHAGWGFWVSLTISCAAMVGAYALMAWLLGRFGVTA